MKKYLLILLLLVNKSPAQTLTSWPSSRTPQVGFSYGMNEDFYYPVGTLLKTFHDGIDIHSESGIDNVLAAANGEFWGELSSPPPYNNQFNLIFRIDAQHFLMYGHCQELPSNSPDLYQGGLPNHGIVHAPQTFQAGVTMCTTRPHNLANLYFDHLHFSYMYNPGALPNSGFPSACLNPLELFNNNLFKDPNQKFPILGPINLKDYANNQLIDCSTQSFIFNKIKIIREITDDMGYISPQPQYGNGQQDLKAWCTIPINDKPFIGMKSSPYIIRFSLMKNGSTISTNSISPAQFKFNSNPLDITNTYLLYNFDRKGCWFPDGRYRYNITNIIGLNNILEDRYWNTRLKKNQTWNSTSNALCNDANEAEYPDGNYTLHFEAEDVAGHNTQDNQTVLVDNYLPYLKQVTVDDEDISQSTSQPVYEAHWNWSGGQLSVIPAIVHNRILSDAKPSPNHAVVITATFSEPVQSATLTLPGLPQVQITALHPTPETYTFRINGAQLNQTQTNIVNMSFTAKDLAGNDLLNLDGMHDNATHSAMVYRDEYGNWVNNGNFTGITDATHYFQLGCPGSHRGLPGSPMSSSCMDADFSASATSVNEGDQITFTDLTAPIAGSWLWDFGDGGTSTSQHPVHIYNTAGTYSVKLTAQAGGSEDEELKNDYITVAGTGSGIFHVDFDASSYNILPGQSINFNSICTGLTGNVSYQWEFTGAATANSTNPNPQNIAYNIVTTTNPFPVTLTVLDDIHQTAVDGENSITKYINVTDPGNGSTQISCAIVATQPDPSHQPYTYHFESTVIGGTAPYYQDQWDFGDGYTSLQNAPDHTYAQGGTSYTVTRHVADGDNQQTTCEVIVILNSLSDITNVHFEKDFQGTVAACTHRYKLTAGHDIPGSNIPVEYRWIITNLTGSSTQYENLQQWSPLFYTPADLETGIYDIELQVRYSGTSTTYNHVEHNYITVCQPPAGHFTFVENPNEHCYSFSPNAIHCFIDFDPAPGFTNLPPDQNDPLCNCCMPYYNADCGAPTTTIPPSDYFQQPVVNHLIPYDIHYSPSHWENLPDPINATLTMTAYFNQNADGDHTWDSETKSFSKQYYRCLVSPDLGDNNSACPGGQILLGGNPTEKYGVPNVSYLWTASNGGTLLNPTSANPVFQAASPGTYNVHLLVTDDSGVGTGVSGDIEITVAPLVADAGPPVSACFGSSNKKLIGSASGGSGHYTFLWTCPGGNTNDLSCTNCATPTVTPAANGAKTYTLTVVDATGCSDSRQVTVTTDDDVPEVNAGTDVSGICPGPQVTLTGSVNNPSGNYTYQWFNQSNITVELSSTLVCNINPLTSTSYLFRVTADNGCVGEDVVQVFTDHNLAPQVSLGTDKYECPDQTALLEANISGGTPPYTQYEWKNSGVIILASTPSYEAAYGDNSYMLYVTDQNGCKGFDEINVFASNINIPPATNPVKPVCAGSSIGLHPGSIVESGGFAPFSYEWSPADGLSNSHIAHPQATVDQNTTYSIKVTDSKGCETIVNNYKMVFTYVHTEKPMIYLYPGYGCEDEQTCYTLDNKVEFSPQNTFTFTTQGTSSTQNFAFNPYTEIQTDFTSGGQWSYLWPHASPTSACVHYTDPGTVGVTYTVTSLCGTQFKNKQFSILNRSQTGAYTNDVFIGNSDDEEFPVIAGYNVTASPPIYPFYATVLAGDNIHFRAYIDIDMLPGFEVQNGAEFEAIIEPCVRYWNNLVQENPDSSPVPDSHISANSVTRNTDKNNGLKEMLHESFTIFPNPTTGDILIDISFKTETRAEIIIQDLLGKTIAKIDLGNVLHQVFGFNLNRYYLKEGVYNIKLVTKDNTQNRKVVFMK